MSANDEQLSRRRFNLLHEIRKLCGPEMATKVAADLGGQRIQVSRNPSGKNRLAKIVGLDAARKLGAKCHELDGDTCGVFVPSDIHRRRLETARELFTAGATPKDIAKIIGLGKRQAQSLVQDLRNKRNEEGAGR